MDERAFEILELPKILSRLAAHTSFSAGAELAHSLRPTGDLKEAIRRQQQTSEARQLLATHPNITLGGAHDVRKLADEAAHGFVLEPVGLLDVQSTLRRAGSLKRQLAKLRPQFPLLAELAGQLEPLPHIVEAISQAVSDRGEVLDSASPELARIRRELRIATDRLQNKLRAIVQNPENLPFLQEPIITQRGGRYVIPLKAQFKGKIPGIVHDQSASGATLFIEPLSTVELNNNCRELQLKEKREIRRILAGLSDKIGRAADQITRTVEALAELDLAFAKAEYAEELGAVAPELVPFRPRKDSPNPGATLYLPGARHPLLNPETVVPIDLTLDDETYILVITGPNTGGKTVALKTAGLLALMAQCGLHIPAEPGSRLSVFDGIYADIGDEQSIEQSLSTFSSHMNAIIGILKQATNHSLIVLDELGAGTDPAEGSALGRAILSYLLEQGITTLVSTHHPDLKIFAQTTPGVKNASVEFDPETLAPTYHLVIGLPGRSNALAIAERLGLPEPILERARKMVGKAELRADDMLDQINRMRRETRRAREAAEKAFAEAEQLRKELYERLENIEDERREILRAARLQAEAEIEELRDEIRRLRRRLLAAGLPLEAIRSIQEEAEELEAEVSAPIRRAVTELADPARLHIGDEVWVRPLKVMGQITGMDSEGIEIQIGRMRVRVGRDEIDTERPPVEIPGIPVPEPPKLHRQTAQRPESPGLELDLRGRRVDDALSRLDEYLDAAFLAGLPFVRIIHGKGTGALRRAVRGALREHPLVSSFQPGAPNEGGDGVTIVRLAR